MIAECPGCGQRLRSGWIRCPRCRQLIPGESDKPAELLAVEDRPQWLGPLVGIIAILLATVAVVAVRSGSPGPSQQVTAPAPNPAASVPTPVAQPVDGGQWALHQSQDARRAGYVAYMKGDLLSAIERFQAAVDADPNDAEARNNLGQALVRQNRAADALPHFDEAVRLDSTKWAFRFNRARTYGQLDRWQEAVTEYRAAAEIFPDDYVTCYNLGLALMKLKQYPDSVAALERAVTLAPSEPSFLISLGTAYVGADSPERAKATFEHFLEMAPEDAEAPRVKALLEALAATTAPADSAQMPPA